MKVHSLNGDSYYFDIVVGVLQGDTQAPYLFIICLDYELRTSIYKIKENGFKLRKKQKVLRKNNYRRRLCGWYSASCKCTRPGRNPTAYAGTSHCRHWPQCQFTQNGLYMRFNQTGDISTLNGSSLKLVVKFTYLGSSVSSAEKDIGTWLARTWTANNRLSVIWKSDLTDKIKCSFFQAVVVSILLYGCSIWTLTKPMEKKLPATIQECCEQYWKSTGDRTPENSSSTATYTHHENYQS